MYSHDVCITEPGGGSYDSGTRTFTPGDNAVLWEGKADVQEEAHGRQYIRMMGGETHAARLEVFFKPQDWPDVAAVIAHEHIVVTPLGTGPIKGIRELDQMVFVEPSKPNA